MRSKALLVLGLCAGLAASAVPARAMVGALPAAPAAQPLVKVEYYCSPGFDARYGRCVATASTDQVDLYLNNPGGYDQEEAAPAPVVRHRHRHHGLHERY